MAWTFNQNHANGRQLW